MNWQIIAESKLVENLGWTLAHSLWQIALAAFILWLFLRFFGRKFSANARYGAAVLALGISFMLPVGTFVQISGDAPAAVRREENFDFGQTAKNAENSKRGENLPFVNGAEFAPEEKRETSFGAIENLRALFGKNISAVLPFAVGFWFLGVAFFAFRLTGGAWQLHLLKTREVSAPNAEWQERFFALRERLKIKQSVKFLQSNLVETPVVLGFLKPVVLVPASVFLQISPRELETILAHELAHVRRADAAVNFAQSVVEVLFFYHPCVWWISAVIRREREFATDAAVVEVLNDSQIIYASALANLEAIRQQKKAANQNLPSLATAAVTKGGSLMQRIQKILEKNTETRAKANSAWSAGLALALISAVLLTVFSFTPAADVNARTNVADKKLAVGFVSIPPIGVMTNPPVVIKGAQPEVSDALARALIEKLKAHRVPAVGFVLGGVISDGEKFYPARANIVRLWRDAGFEIGIGGFRHLWFYDTPLEDYIANVEKNERVTRQILAEKGLPLRYFSYPYLNTGKSAEDRDKFEAWLKEHGLTPVKYTVDNQEWMYSYAYDEAFKQNDANKMNEIRTAFLDYMTKMFDHYEAYSQEMFGRDIAQTMVLTPSRLVTETADELFGMLEKRGYRFVSMDEALADEAYQTPDDFINTRDRIGKSGISWFERWQMARGKKLRDEPRVNATVWKMWNERNAKGK